MLLYHVFLGFFIIFSSYLAVNCDSSCSQKLEKHFQDVWPPLPSNPEEIGRLRICSGFDFFFPDLHWFRKNLIEIVSIYVNLFF